MFEAIKEGFLDVFIAIYKIGEVLYKIGEVLFCDKVLGNIIGALLAVFCILFFIAFLVMIIDKIFLRVK